MTLRILEDAEKESLKAARWYENEKAGMGDLFLDALSQALKKIEYQPDFYGQVETLKTPRIIRRCPLHGFPYLVIYETRLDEVIILAVTHMHRRPHYWKRRR